MKAFFTWFLNNALVAVAMTLSGGIVAGIYQAQEVSGTQYRVLVDAWPQLHDTTKSHIREAFADGHITRWAYTDLFREAIADTAALAITPGLQVEEERKALAKVLAN